IATQENTMKDTDIKRLLYVHLLCISSIILSIFIPSFFLENFSVLETHLTWLCICSVSVTAVNLVLYLVVKPNASSKRSSLSYKVTRFLKCCIYFLMSCFSFHVGVGNIFTRSYFVHFYYCTLFMFVRTKLQSMAKSFQ
ncbi:hypothetical protein E2I00_010732, partial [Balaenoptera physalus]